jgi:hypothetical protein
LFSQTQNQTNNKNSVSKKKTAMWSSYLDGLAVHDQDAENKNNSEFTADERAEYSDDQEVLALTYACKLEWPLDENDRGTIHRLLRIFTFNLNIDTQTGEEVRDPLDVLELDVEEQKMVIANSIDARRARLMLPVAEGGQSGRPFVKSAWYKYMTSTFDASNKARQKMRFTFFTGGISFASLSKLATSIPHLASDIKRHVALPINEIAYADEGVRVFFEYDYRLDFMPTPNTYMKHIHMAHDLVKDTCGGDVILHVCTSLPKLKYTKNGDAKISIGLHLVFPKQVVTTQQLKELGLTLDLRITADDAIYTGVVDSDSVHDRQASLRMCFANKVTRCSFCSGRDKMMKNKKKKKKEEKDDDDKGNQRKTSSSSSSVAFSLSGRRIQQKTTTNKRKKTTTTDEDDDDRPKYPSKRRHLESIRGMNQVDMEVLDTVCDDDDHPSYGILDRLASDDDNDMPTLPLRVEQFMNDGQAEGNKTYCNLCVNGVILEPSVYYPVFSVTNDGCISFDIVHQPLVRQLSSTMITAIPNNPIEFAAYKAPIDAPQVVDGRVPGGPVVFKAERREITQRLRRVDTKRFTSRQEPQLFNLLTKIIRSCTDADRRHTLPSQVAVNAKSSTVHVDLRGPGARVCPLAGREHTTNRVYSSINVKRGIVSFFCYNADCKETIKACRKFMYKNHSGKINKKSASKKAKRDARLQSSVAAVGTGSAPVSNKATAVTEGGNSVDVNDPSPELVDIVASRMTFTLTPKVRNELANALGMETVSSLSSLGPLSLANSNEEQQQHNKNNKNKNKKNKKNNTIKKNKEETVVVTAPMTVFGVMKMFST